jgi:bacterioferritin (cytochrome b1)
MTGNPQVIEALCSLVHGEASQMVQLRIQSQIFRDHGYVSLKHKLHGFFYGCNTCQKKLINRVLLLGGDVPPDALVAEAPTVGAGDVSGIFSADLALMGAAASAANAAAKIADSADDHGTEKLLMKMVVKKEHKAKWFQKQLSVIADIGTAAYLEGKQK